jgi:N-methylhydantoinase B
VGVVNEQVAALMRTSFTSIVREAGDLSAAVFDRRGFMVAQAVTGTPGHIKSMALAMKHFLAAYPVGTLEPGDVLITNDPWKTSRRLERRHDLHPGVPGARLRRLLRLPPATRPTSAATCSPPRRARSTGKGSSSPS